MKSCSLKIGQSHHILIWLTAILMSLSIYGCGARNKKVNRGIYIVPREDVEIGTGICREGSEGVSWAVIVGVNHYQDSGIPTLSGAAQDAWNMYHYLTHADGGGVHPRRTLLLLNHEATKAAVEEALGSFLAKACPQDRLIVYFAGHGAPEPDKPDNAFLLVHDTRLGELVSTGISMTLLPTFLQWRNADTGRLLLLVDACHAGALRFPNRRGFSQTSSQGEDEALRRASAVTRSLTQSVSSQTGWGVIAAAAPDQQASEGDEGCMLGGKRYQGGVFTCALLNAIGGTVQASARSISYDGLFNHLSDTMLTLRGTAQLPQRSGTLEGRAELFRSPARPIPIPPFPERYLREDTSALRPWIWGTLSTALLSSGLGLYFQREANATTSELNHFLDRDTAETQSRALYEQKSVERSSDIKRAQGAFLTAGLTGLTALTLALIEVSQQPPPPSHSYELPPSFYVGTPASTPTASGGGD